MTVGLFLREYCRATRAESGFFGMEAGALIELIWYRYRLPERPASRSAAPAPTQLP
jgi:hypothetical protein